MDELIEMHLISWSDSCAWLSGTWLEFHVAIIPAKTDDSVPHCAHIPLFELHEHPESIDECQWVPFIPHGGIEWHTFASYALPCQMPFCQSASLLPAATQQQDVTEDWWKGSTSTVIPPIFTSDVTGYHNKIGGITFGAALIFHSKAAVTFW